MKKILPAIVLLGALALPACILVVVNDRPRAEEEWDDEDDEDEEDDEEREDER